MPTGLFREWPPETHTTRNAGILLFYHNVVISCSELHNRKTWRYRHVMVTLRLATTVGHSLNAARFPKVGFCLKQGLCLDAYPHS